MADVSRGFDPIPLDCKLFLFDMGNVVVKNITMLDEIAEQYHLDKEEFFQDYRHYDFPLMEGEVSSDQYWQHIQHVFGVSVEGNPFYDAFHPVFNEEIVNLIKKLRTKGYRVVCASNTFASHWQKLETMGALALFDAVYASHILRISKPSKQFFKAILDAEKVSANHAYFVDDFKENVERARALGLASLCYASSCELHDAFAAFL